MINLNSFENLKNRLNKNVLIIPFLVSKCKPSKE